MGGLSLTHMILIGIVLLVFFGPSRLPGLGKSMGEAIRGFKKGLNGDEIDVTDANRQDALRSGQANPSIHSSQPDGQAGQQASTQSQRDPSRDGRS